MSKLQNTFFEKLKEILGDRIRYEINYRPKYLKDVNKTMPYEIDVYVNCLKIGFEVQGQQHFHHVPIFHNNPDVSRYNDEKKKELAKHKKVYIIEIFDSEVKLEREALKNLIVRRSKTVLPEKRFKKLIDAIVIQAKIRRNSKRKLSHEDYEIMVESKIQQKMLETGFMPVFS